MRIEQLNYRKIDKLNATAIKTFDKDRFAFYRQFVLKEKKKENFSPYIVLGNLVDFALSDCLGNWEDFERRFDEKFKLLSVKKGSGQFFELADALYELTIRDMDEEGNLISSFEDRFKEAFDNLQAKDKFKGKTIEFALEKFKGSDAEIYFSENLSCMDKMVVDSYMIDKCKYIVENVVSDENIGFIFQNLSTDVEYLGKSVIEFEYSGIECKCEIDNLQIDHFHKNIVITEIKSSWDIEQGFEYTYLKLRYDLAAVFYFIAIRESFLKNKKYEDYLIKFQFLAIDTSTKQQQPLLYTLSDLDILKSLKGFYTKSGRYYKGLEELIDEIKWAQSTQNWKISKPAYENKSILPLEINYE